LGSYRYFYLGMRIVGTGILLCQVVNSFLESFLDLLSRHRVFALRRYLSIRSHDSPPASRVGAGGAVGPMLDGNWRDGDAALRVYNEAGSAIKTILFCSNEQNARGA
jgi:hypothetical protein